MGLCSIWWRLACTSKYPAPDLVRRELRPLPLLQDIPFRQLRMHGILDDDMSVSGGRVPAGRAYLGVFLSASCRTHPSAPPHPSFPSFPPSQTYLNGAANMYNVFSVYDFLQSISMKPIVELSFMPELLASNASMTTFHYQGGISPPADWNKWFSFIQQFVTALSDRYGSAEIATWKFEVW